jgi:hypothetical protein
MKSFPVSYIAKMPESGGQNRKEKVGLPYWLNLPNILLVLIIMTALASAVMIALQQPQGIAWLFASKPLVTPGSFPEDVGKALGPILALALAIERLVETIFNIFENNVRQVAKYGSAGAEGLNYLNQVSSLYYREMLSARNMLRVAVDASADNSTPVDKSLLIKRLEDAEKRFTEASNRIFDLPKDPKYVAWKRVISIWLGLFLGLLVAVFSDEGIFQHLNMSVPRLMDMLITGFVIGAGSGPMHSLIGILQSAKTTLDNVGSFTGLGTVKQEIQNLRDEIKK